MGIKTFPFLYFTLEFVFMKKIILVLLIFLNYTHISAFEQMSAKSKVDFPPPFIAHYKVYSKGLPIGEGSRSLSYRTDGTFVLEGQVNTTGMLALFRDDKVTEFSSFMLKQDRVLPLEYRYQHSGSKKQKQVHITFDWQRKSASSKIEPTWQLPLEEGMLDDQVYQVVLMQELAYGKRDVRYKVIDDGKIKEYVPVLLGKVFIETPLGKLETLQYQRTSADKKRQTTLWCAPDFHYLPVQIEHNEKGTPVTMVLQSVQWW